MQIFIVITERFCCNLVRFPALLMSGSPEPGGPALQTFASFGSNVCKVNGLLNKLSIVPPPGIFFFPN